VTAKKINAEALGVLGSQGVKVIHVSTDYVFSGDEHVPCRETDPVAPRTAYGRTKYEGEKMLLAACPEAVILRTAWLYSSFGNNFVKTMLRLGREKDQLGVIFDQIGTPTYARDLAAAIMTAINQGIVPGIYHFTDEGVASWYDFAAYIHECWMRNVRGFVKINGVTTKEYGSTTKRPYYSVLDKTKYKTDFKGLTIPKHWHYGVEKIVEKLLITA
jgi:dTDP-4-dehydrorhamnose reductase